MWKYGVEFSVGIKYSFRANQLNLLIFSYKFIGIEFKTNKFNFKLLSRFSFSMQVFKSNNTKDSLLCLDIEKLNIS